MARFDDPSVTPKVYERQQGRCPVCGDSLMEPYLNREASYERAHVIAYDVAKRANDDKIMSRRRTRIAFASMWQKERETATLQATLTAATSGHTPTPADRQM